LAIPLSLSAFTHLWNPIGFPYFVGDEGHYIRRSLQILEQFDPQETARYDHPYFGQLFLAGLFKLIGYPASLNPVSGDVNSTQMLYMVPRIIMGLLAVLDTFLIYKICELLYTRNKAIAFIGSILFAVMPLTWLTRRVYLDSIQLPLILLSILLAIYFYNNSKTRDNSVKGSAWRLGEFINKGTLPIILSGIALGLAIFTKIPALTMIPVIAYLIFRANKKYRERIKNLGLWLIPVILIPAIWPAYAISVGEYDNWYNGVFSQAGREGSGIGSIGILFKIDPVLVSIGIIGIIFATVIKKDLFLLIWIIPFLIFHTIIPWTQHFHWIQVLPVFCIAGALLLDGVASILGRKPGVTSYSTLDNYTTDNRLPSMAIKIGVLSILRRFYDKYLGRVMRLPKTTLIVIMVVPITIFGILSTSLLVTANINSSFFEMVTFVSQSLPNYKEVDTKDGGKGLCLWCNAPINRNSGEGMNEDAKETDEDNKVTVIGNHWIFGTFWIPKYVYGLDHVFKGFFTEASVDTEKVLIVADSRLLDAISSENPDEHIRELQALYGNSTTVAKFEEKRPKFNDQIYPFQSMSENRGIGKIEVKANY
jgi:dolichyl-phosphate-mannose-protein mannosyltransferase